MISSKSYTVLVNDGKYSKFAVKRNGQRKQWFSPLIDYNLMSFRR